MTHKDFIISAILEKVQKVATFEEMEKEDIKELLAFGAEFLGKNVFWDKSEKEWRYRNNGNTFYLGKAYNKINEHRGKVCAFAVVSNFRNEKEKITYKKVVEAYMNKHYGKFELLEGENAPRLAKQVKKQLGIDLNQKALQHFTELSMLFKSLKEPWGGAFYHKQGSKPELPEDDYEMDEWAFNDSCNSSGSSYGRNTVNFFRQNIEEMRYLKLYVKNEHTERKALRAYFVADNDWTNFGHSGSYINKHLMNADYFAYPSFWCTAYYSTSLLLNYIFFDSSFLAEEFCESDGLNIVDNECSGVWANIGDSTDYTKYETSEGFLQDLGAFYVEDYVYCENTESYLPADDERVVWSNYHDCYLEIGCNNVIYSDYFEDYFEDMDSLLEKLEIEYV